MHLRYQEAAAREASPRFRTEAARAEVRLPLQGVPDKEVRLQYQEAAVKEASLQYKTEAARAEARHL